MATIEDQEIEAKLKALHEDFDRNEELMRQAARKYEDLVAEKEMISGAIGELKKQRAEGRKKVKV